MTMTPEGGRLSAVTSPGRLPTRTWRVDPETGRLAGFADGLEAMRQAVEIALAVRRFRWQIYGPNVGHQLGPPGEDFGAACVTVQTQVQDALRGDDRVSGVEEFHFTQAGERMLASFTVKTIFGALSAEVKL